MPAAPLPPNEVARLAALRGLGILDTPPDEEFDALAHAASLACGVPFALVSLIDEDRAFIKAAVGMTDFTDTPRKISFCAHTILGTELVEVEDAREDQRFADNPLVLDGPLLRFYASIPLRLSDGSAVGTLCVVDQQTRQLNEAQRSLLRALGTIAAKSLENWRTARDLRTSQARLRRLYEATPAMLHSIDEQGVLLSVSDTWLNRLGYSRDEVIGRPAADFLSPQSQIEQRSRLAWFFATGFCENIEYQMVRKNGALLDAILSAIVDHDGEGGARRSLTAIEDVTLRRAAERALDTQQQRLADIIESSALGTWEWNAQTDVAMVSDRWAAMLGWTVAELPPLMRRNRHDRMHPQDVERATAQLAHHLAGDTDRYEIEFRVRHRDGNYIWMLDRGAVITRTADGRPEWMFGIRQDISERKRQEEALRTTQDLLDRTGRVAGVGGWELDLLTNELVWSAETCRITGVPADYRPTVATAIDFYAPEARPVIRAAIDRSIASGEGWDLEVPFVRWDGSPIWVRAVATVSFADGRPARLNGALQDITTLVAQRQALQQANERVKLATESGGIGIWEWDIVHGMMTWDASMYRLYDLRPRDDVGTYQIWSQGVHPDDRAATEQAVRDTLAGIAPYNVEFRVVWTDGSVRHIRGTGRVTRDPAGRALSMVGASWDVTEARVLAAQLTRQLEHQAEASERETALFRNASDLLSVIRVEAAAGETVFRFEAMNPAATRIAGWQPEELIGQRPEECLPPELADALVQQYTGCVTRGAPITFELSVATPNGHRDLEGSLTPIRHPANGRIERLASAIRDVTERKRLEAVVHHGKKMEAIGGIAAGVAHDFNNILQSITSSLELVQDTLPVGSAIYDVANIGLDSAKRGAYLTHHLLSYARMQMLRPQLLALTTLLSDVRTLLRRTLRPEVLVTILTDSAAPDVWVDRGQIQTALLNLATNAAQAMPAGGSLVIEGEAILNAGHPWARITVSDTGTGMDAATVERAVEPFFTTRGLDGSGLGLSMVQGFAEQSGGRLSISSVLGQGTRVVLELPAAAEPAAAAPPMRLEQPGENRKIACVLLVDDHADVLLTTGTFLENAGFKVIQAASAEQALALLEQGVEIDALVTDYSMPGMNGSDLINRARAARAGLPGVIISGFTDVGDMEPLGVGTVTLRKPFSRASLINALRGLGAQGRAAEPAHGSTAGVLDAAATSARA